MLGGVYDATMLPGSLKAVFIACLLTAGIASACAAQTAPDVRYHFGDDARWADQNLDDSSWSVAADGRVPVPAVDTDGFVWIRVKVGVPQDAAAPLAIRWGRTPGWPDVQEVFVNGTRVGQIGSFPPKTAVTMMGQDLVFDLPPGLARAGSEAEVTIRGWILPVHRDGRKIPIKALSIDRADLQRSAAGEARARNLLSYMPQFAIDLLLEVLGAGCWRWGFGRGARSSSYARFGL